MEYKYIKRVNWPWVEIIDNYTPEDTIIINIDDIAAVWSRYNTRYRGGVRFTHGEWSEVLSVNALRELKNLIMEHDRNTD